MPKPGHPPTLDEVLAEGFHTGPTYGTARVAGRCRNCGFVRLVSVRTKNGKPEDPHAADRKRCGICQAEERARLYFSEGHRWKRVAAELRGRRALAQQRRMTRTAK